MPDLYILLVDDSDFFLELEKGFLQHTPATILTASNGQEALEVVSGTRPDLIFMDLSMPEMDGATCCAKLKAHPLWRSIPVIMVYTPREEGEVERCRQAGCDAMLPKPVDRRVFLETGRRFLRNIDRRGKRAPCRFMVVFQRDNESGYAMSADLSIGGLYLGSRDPIHREEDLKLSFLLPGDDSPVIETEARVAWVNQGAHRPKQSYPEGFGVEFREIPADSHHLIKRFLRELS